MPSTVKLPSIRTVPVLSPIAAGSIVNVAGPVIKGVFSDESAVILVNVAESVSYTHLTLPTKA